MFVERYEYDVFGQCTIHTDPGPDGQWMTSDDEISFTSSVGNPYLFTGRRFDSETGLYYYRARYYDPYIGRFLQVDPIYYAAGLNLYSYCGNNPINWIDPWGLLKEDLDFVGHLTGAAWHGVLGMTAWGADQLTRLPPSPSFSEQAGCAPPWVQSVAWGADVLAMWASILGKFSESITGEDWSDIADYHRGRFYEHWKGVKRSWPHFKDDFLNEIPRYPYIPPKIRYIRISCISKSDSGKRY